MGNRKNMCCFPSVEDPLGKDDAFYVCRSVQGQVLLWGRKGSVFPYSAQVGPDWYCTVITYGLLIVPSGLFLLNVAADWGWGMLVPGFVLTLALIVTYTFTACNNPGIVWRQHEDEEAAGTGTASLIDCGTCKLKRPVTAYHCYDCGVCVEHLDHHCPWTGKCIGRDNIKYFYAFLSFLGLQILFVIVCTIVSASYGNDVSSSKD